MPLLGFFGSAAETVAIVVVTLVLTFVTLVFGELAPKRIAMQRAERWALLVARPLDLLASFTRPAVWLLGATSDLVVRLVGLDPKHEPDEIGPDELRDIVAGNHGFTKEQRTIIAGAVEIADRRLRAVLVPRLQVFTLDSGTTAEAARLVLAATGHSRAPVVRHGGLDDAVGVIHLRDLVGVPDDRPVDECARPPMLLPDSLPVVDALRQFKAERQHIALVVDERGAVDGIVTLEDILEEIVGEIYDETDRDVRAVRTEADGALVLPGTFPVHDLTDIGVELPNRPAGDYTTVAGLVLTCLGHIPTVAGENVTVDGWELTVADVDQRAITQVTLRRRVTAATTPRTPKPSAPTPPTRPTPLNSGPPLTCRPCRRPSGPPASGSPAVGRRRRTGSRAPAAAAGPVGGTWWVPRPTSRAATRSSHGPGRMPLRARSADRPPGSTSARRRARR